MANDLRRVAAVTGASSGIGMETALAFARRGYGVVLAARRVDRLEQVAQQCRRAGGEPLAVPTDVACREQVDAMVAAAVERFGRLDVLVNNAGYGQFGAVADLDEAKLRRLFDVNVFGLWYGLAAAVPVMRRQGGGHIFNVSSVIGKRGTPMHGAYCASKFAVSGLTESARIELREEKIHVTLVCPALTQTEFLSVDRQLDLSFKKLHRAMPARPIGEAIARTAGKYKPELVFTFGGRLLARLSAVWPRAVDYGMSRYYRDLVRTLAAQPEARTE